MRTPRDPDTVGSRQLWTARRHDPAQLLNLAVLYARPQLSPEVQRWGTTWLTRPGDETPEQPSRRISRASVRGASFGGMLIGSSFWVGLDAEAALRRATTSADRPAATAPGPGRGQPARNRARFVAGLGALAVVLVGVAVVVAPHGWLAHHLPFGGLVLAECALLAGLPGR